MSSSNSQAFLTPTGVSTHLKDALLARFPHVRAAFNQTAFIESLNLPHQVLADIWLPVGFPPVSFEPLNEEEEKVAQTGQFNNPNIRARNNPNYNQGAPNEYRSNRGNNPNNATGITGRQQGNRSRGSSFVANTRGPRHEFSDRPGFQHQSQHQSYSHDDDVIEDPDNLWATPSSDAIGSSDFGTFDENGMFRTGAISSVLDGGLEEFSSSAAAFEGFMQTRPHHHQIPSAPVVQQAPIPAPPVVQQAPIPAPPVTVAIPHITPDTQWLYRDPSGQIQGPFSSYRMLEWYNGKYFPENLPLRREQDAFFEPLSTWKTKCAGQVPFAAYSPEKPVVIEQPRPAPEIISKPEIPTVSVAAARTVSVESLFGAQPFIEKPSSPEVMMPGAGAGWKKLEKPSIAAKFGQLDLNQPQTEASILNFTKPSEPEIVPSSAVVEPVKPPVVEAPKPTPLATATSSWSNSSASNGSFKKISLSEILKSSEEPKIILENEKPPVAVVEPAIVPASSAGWAKLSASPVQSLSSIQAEEARASSTSGPSSSASASSTSASKSFADLVRSAGVITSGDIVVSPISARAPLVKERPSPMTQTDTTVPVSKPVNQTPSAPVTVAAAASPVTSASKTVSVEDWCLSALKQSPLAKSIDPQTCTILLMDLPNPAAILSFALETLKPMDSSNAFDLAAFAQELSQKKFGPKATEKVQWTKLKTIPQVKKQEESFEVVKRKK